MISDDDAKMARVHGIPKKSDNFPSARVAGTQHDVVPAHASCYVSFVNSRAED
jgi:hypothetical protein